MPPLKTLESGVSSFIMQVSESRPRQTSKLATLPTEIVYQIAKCIDKGNENDYARDIRSLALSSANLFNIIRSLFYKAANYGCFTRALQVADVAMMERSYEFGDMELLPEDEVGGKCVRENAPEDCKCKSIAPHARHRPIDYLLDGIVRNGWTSQHYQALVWLHQKGFRLNEVWLWNFSEECKADFVKKRRWSLNLPKPGNLIPEILLNLLQKPGLKRHEAHGICEMIRFLSINGYTVPVLTNVAMSPVYLDRTPLHDMQLGKVWSGAFTIELAMRSCCPPLLLELLLQDYARRGYSLAVLEDNTEKPPFALKDWYDCVKMFDFFDPWDVQTYIIDILKTLNEDLADPLGWQRANPGEAADTWEQKIKILNHFNAIDQYENDLLVAILQALRAMERMSTIGNEVYGDQKLARWEIFCESVKPFLYTSELQSDLANSDPKKTRLHRFVMPREDVWNPWYNWHINHQSRSAWVLWCSTQDHDSKALENRVLQDVEGIWGDFKRHLVRDRGFWIKRFRARSDTLPRWFEVSYTEWLNSVESMPL